MKKLVINLVVAFWSILLGEVLSLIDSELSYREFQPIQSGIIALILGLLVINLIPLISNNQH